MERTVCGDFKEVPCFISAGSVLSRELLIVVFCFIYEPEIHCAACSTNVAPFSENSKSK